MLDKLFKYPTVLARHLDAPLTKERDGYLEYRASEGIALATLVHLADELLVVAQSMDWSSVRRITIEQIEKGAASWAHGQQLRGRSAEGIWSRSLFASTAKQWLRFLGWLEEPVAPEPAFGNLIQDFVNYLRKDRGLSPASINNLEWHVRQFLRWFADRTYCFDQINVREVDAFLSYKGKQSWGRVSVATSAKALRTFFRYAELRGWCCSGIAAAIVSPRIFKQETLPSGPTWSEVLTVLDSTNGDSRADVRDRSILMLFATYGFRSGEVKTLRLEDLDWEQEMISVHRSKQRRTQRYPLRRQVGEAILRYLREVRPRCAHREVFLTLKAPFRPISTGGFYDIISKRFSKLGIEVTHRGPHCLRHACATRLVAQGFSLKEVGDHLGHRSPEATRIYAKVDLLGLRQVADFDLGGLA